ncbi:MAG: hypothetical protein FJZ86_13600 [Chloroflexi bacterium]|nr:hypothetical protein [Chloroflexota bacterium]
MSCPQADPQSPHTEDEVYYVAKNMDAARKFHSIEEERRAEFIEALTVLVFTSTGSVQASR